MIELPLLKYCLRGHFLMKLIIKVKMSNKTSELFNFFFFSTIAFRIEIQNISSPFVSLLGMASTLKNINKAVEYTFKMKNPPSLNKKTVYGMRKTLKQRKFAVKTTYSSTRSISGVTFSKTFNNKTEALNLLYEIKDKTQPVNMVSFDQIQMAEFQIKGPWGEDRKLSANSFGAVKLVCEILPSVSCWVALTI